MGKFIGPTGQFKSAIESLQLNGKWEDFIQGLRYKTSDGGVITWYSSTGTILIQGTKNAQKNINEHMGKLNFEGFPEAYKDDEPEIKTKNKGGSKIFVVHGHDTTSREQLELVLHKLGLEPFVLANTGGGGLTIIEALEKEIGKDGKSKFGIVLLTPDDFGYAKSDGADKAQPRARQNVVLEMGMLMAAIGRTHTVILKKGHLEVPSDAHGILYLGFNDHVKETVPRLVDRLKDAGFEIDPGRITNAAS